MSEQRGSGYYDHDCETCSGTGEAAEEDQDGRTTYWGRCPTCRGTGYEPVIVGSYDRWEMSRIEERKIDVLSRGGTYESTVFYNVFTDRKNPVERFVLLNMEMFEEFVRGLDDARRQLAVLAHQEGAGE